VKVAKFSDRNFLKSAKAFSWQRKQLMSVMAAKAAQVSFKWLNGGSMQHKSANAPQCSTMQHESVEAAQQCTRTSQPLEQACAALAGMIDISCFR
jgi:hypothetical protein